MTDNKKYDYFIYKLYNPDCDYVYVGSTRNMAVRKKCHKSDCNNVNSVKYNYKVYKTIRDNDGFENWHIVVLEIMDNVTKMTAEMREDAYRVDLNATMNSKRASRGDISIEEYKKQHYQDNKEHYQEYKKHYIQENRETILEYNKQYRINNKELIKQKHDCECGGKYTFSSKSTHMKTNKHNSYVLSLAI
jgi:hypothetical protein